VFFWYLGVGCALLLLTLGPRRIDYRLALLGLILPLGDVVIRILAYPHSRLGVHLYLHTFAFALVLALAVMTFLRGATARRWFVVPMAAVIHLLLAGMLGDPVGLFWPLLGSHFATLPEGVRLASRVLPLSGVDIVKELLGIAALVYIAFAFGLDKPAPRKDFLRTGTLSTRRRAAGMPAVE
jgi:membrane-bound metal-dependent hydrolase YbcI (DUF457 family)